MSTSSKSRSTPRKGSTNGARFGAIRRRVLHPISRLFSSGPTTTPSIDSANHDTPDSDPQAHSAATGEITTLSGAVLLPVEYPISIPGSDVVKPSHDEAAQSHWYSQMTPGNDDPPSLTYEDALAIKASMKPVIRQQLKDGTMQSIVKLRIRDCNSEQELQALNDQLAALDASCAEINAFIDSRRSLTLHAEAVIDAHKKEAFRRKGLPLYYTPQLNTSDVSLSDDDP